MSDTPSAQLLTEIRDLLQAQGARQQQALEVQQRSFAIQQEAVATQNAAVRLQRRVMRFLMPLLGIVAVLIVLTTLIGRR